MYIHCITLITILSLGCTTPCPDAPTIPDQAIVILNADHGKDCKPLTAEEMAKITSLNLSVAGIQDICFLSRFLALKELRLDSNSISNIGPLADLTELESLELQLNQITDLSPLSSLTKLKYLGLRKNKIRSLKPLHNLKSLRRLYLFGNPLSAFEIRSLQKELPNCDVRITD